MEKAVVEIRLAWRRVAAADPDDDRVDVAEEILDDLLARLAEPHRRYHTAEHVMWVLRHADALAMSADQAEPLDRDVITVAALFHDVIYDPRSATNEADSAAFAVAQMAKLGWGSGRCHEVSALILATAGHEASSPEAAVLLDADLAVLGGSPPDYRAYVAAVRAEYAHVGDEAWRAGRAVVLRTFVDRPRIFVTTAMALQREGQARKNLLAELDALCG